MLTTFHFIYHVEKSCFTTLLTIHKLRTDTRIRHPRLPANDDTENVHTTTPGYPTRWFSLSEYLVNLYYLEKINLYVQFTIPSC